MNSPTYCPSSPSYAPSSQQSYHYLPPAAIEIMRNRDIISEAVDAAIPALVVKYAEYEFEVVATAVAIVLQNRRVTTLDNVTEGLSFRGIGGILAKHDPLVDPSEEMGYMKYYMVCDMGHRVPPELVASVRNELDNVHGLFVSDIE
jgi:hypothetical protein